MTRLALLASSLAALPLAACSHGVRRLPMNDDAPHRAEILQTVDAVFLALARSDADAVAALHSPGAVNVIAEPEKAGAIRYRPVAEMITRMRKGDFPKFRESYFDPIVLERGGLAVVWTPYAIEQDGATKHCGVDIFTLSKHRDMWKIDSFSFTIEPSACAEIAPGEGSAVRPDFGALDAKEN